MLTRLCQKCRKRLALGKRQDARFCSDRCRVQWHRIREREQSVQAAAEALAKPLTRRIERRALEELLGQALPPGAVRYRLGMQQEHSLALAYHPLDGAAYSLSPFQAPQVPRPGRYAVMYVDGDGKVLPTPVQLAGGVYLTEAFVRRIRRPQPAAVQP